MQPLVQELGLALRMLERTQLELQHLLRELLALRLEFRLLRRLSGLESLIDCVQLLLEHRQRGLELILHCLVLLRAPRAMRLKFLRHPFECLVPFEKPVIELAGHGHLLREFGRAQLGEHLGGVLGAGRLLRGDRRVENRGQQRRRQLVECRGAADLAPGHPAPASRRRRAHLFQEPFPSGLSRLLRLLLRHAAHLGEQVSRHEGHVEHPWDANQNRPHRDAEAHRSHRIQGAGERLQRTGERQRLESEVPLRPGAHPLGLPQGAQRKQHPERRAPRIPVSLRRIDRHRHVQLVDATGHPRQEQRDPARHRQAVVHLNVLPQIHLLPLVAAVDDNRPHPVEARVGGQPRAVPLRNLVTCIHLGDILAAEERADRLEEEVG